MTYIVATSSKKDGKEIYLADLNRVPKGIYWTEEKDLAFTYSDLERARFKCMTLLYNNPRVVTL